MAKPVGGLGLPYYAYDSSFDEKPIDLQYICLFYLCHIPTFLDIHLSKLLQEPSTEPEVFRVSFLFFRLQVEISSQSIIYSAHLMFVPKSCIHVRRQL